MNLAWYIAKRLRSGNTRNGFISFISASSTLGIGLGCFVLILLLSVMNGFEYELRNRLLSVIPHGELFAVSPDGIQNWQSEVAMFQQDPRFTHVQPYTKATGMLQKGAAMKAVELTGLAPDYATGNELVSKIDPAHWQQFAADDNGVILGQGILDKLGVSLGDRVQLLLPRISDDLKFQAPRTTWLNVAGSIAIGGELDNHIGLVHLEKASQALGVETGALGIRFQLAEPFDAFNIMRDTGYDFEQHVYISDWTRTQGHLYQDIQLVRTVVYLALTLVIAVACFNIVSSLVISVKEKQGEIAMLKTMGAENALIRQVFIFQGILNGIIGTLLGVVSGVFVATYLSEIVLWIESTIGIRMLSGDIYFIDFLPSVVLWPDVAVTAMIALALSLLATLYPAQKASKIDPAVALGY